MSSSRAIAALQFLGWVEPAAPPRRSRRATPPPPRTAADPRRRPAPQRRPAIPLALRALIWLGMAQAPIVVTGHPRIRQRVLANLEQRRRRDRIATASVGALLVTALLGIGVVRSPLLAVETVALVGLDQAQRDAVSEVLGVRPGTNVLDVDLDALAQRAEELPWVSVATARRRFPSTVEVRVAVSRPVAAGIVGQTMFLLDATGRAVEALPLDADGEPLPADGTAGVSAQGDAAALPRLALTVPPVVGQASVDEQVRTATAIAAAMPTLVQEWITGYRIGPDGVDADLRVPTASGPMTFVARLGRAEDVRAKAATLAAVVDEALTRGMSLSAVDVRIHDRPVVRT